MRAERSHTGQSGSVADRNEVDQGILINVGIHDWIDVASGFGLIAITVIAVLLGSRLSRSEALREKVNNHGERIAKIEGHLRL